MSNAPKYNLDLDQFWHDPYPDLKAMRQIGPVVFVPQLNANLFTRRDDIFVHEKKIEIYSSVQPGGLMTRLMGQNMMRKDGAAHRRERKNIFPTISPKTVADQWQAVFMQRATEVVADVAPMGELDLANHLAKRLAGQALIAITGLASMSWQDMDRVSQAMIDGIANFAGDPAVEARCIACTGEIEAHIDDMAKAADQPYPFSLLAVLLRAGVERDEIYANIKLAISGGQNETRDVIAGLVWALLTHPQQLEQVKAGELSWQQAFDEYVRWISPIGMSPRRVAQPYRVGDVDLEPDEVVFFMFGSANRDERVFDQPDSYKVGRDCTPAIAFGAGPHFCAGAWAAKCFIAQAAVPEIFARLRGLRLSQQTKFGGWAFRGPLEMPVQWDV